MEQEKELMVAIETAKECMEHGVAVGNCTCDGEEDHLCDHCLVVDVLTRLYLYVNNRAAAVNYGEEVNKASIYPGKDQGILGLLYAVLGMVGEAGEVANALKKELRDNQRVVDFLNRTVGQASLKELGVDTRHIAEEVGDILFYVHRTAAEAGYWDLREIMGVNIVKIRGKRKKILDERKRRHDDEQTAQDQQDQ